MIARMLPRPFLSLTILALWLVLAASVSFGQLILGAVIAIVVPIATAPFWPEPLRVRRPLTGLRLLAVLLFDVVVANLRVARLVVGPLERLRPQFIEVPIDIEDRFVAAILGSVVALTPGTVSVGIDPRRRVLLVHALDEHDPQALIDTIKARYEAPLKETFGC
ncbi:MAG: Na+/H+ antiporter subunit E [Hyphomicrobiaceae bacterium]|nr:Na+/H+ antiporter subunit E [Hyphomicrobiaceae bacterium]